MESKTTVLMFSILAIAVVFTITSPMDYVYAQTSGVSADGEGEYKDDGDSSGEHEGKSCPFKERQGASVNDVGLNI